MASPFAIGSAIGGIVLMMLSVGPIPAKQFALLRTVAAGIGSGIFAVGYCATKADEKREREIAAELAKIKEEEDFEREQARKDKLAIAESQREAFVIETKKKEAARIEVAIADYVDDVRDAYVAVQDGKGRLDRCLLNQRADEDDEKQQVEPEIESSEQTEQTVEDRESLAAKKAKLLKLINEHEGGWIGQCMKKPILIYGDQGSGKSYFAEFLALCRLYLRGHEIVSIADPHFHQNKDYCWHHLVKLKVSGFGAHHNYKEVNSQILAMYDGFAIRTLKSKPQTPIFDEVTRYGQEEDTKEAAAKFGSKLSSDPRKANSSPILIAHAKTLAALGGGEGFADAIQGNFIRIKLNSNSEQEPLWRGTISGIKDEDGEPIENMKISIAPDWIRSSWVFALFNSEIEKLEEFDKKQEPLIQSETETDAAKLNRILEISDDYWLAESDPEKLERLIDLRKKTRENTGTQEGTQDAQVPQVETSSPSQELVEPLADGEFPRSWSAADFSRFLPNEDECEMFEKLLAYLDTSKNASDIIKYGLGFTKEKYSKFGKPCFKYLVRTRGSIELIKHFSDYLEKE